MILGGGVCLGDANAQGSQAPGAVAPTTGATLGLGFIENRGQFDHGVDFVARSPQLLTRLGGNHVQWILSEPNDLRGRLASRRPEDLEKLGDPDLSPDRVGIAGMTFEGSRRGVRPTGDDLRETYVNFFVGNDPARWASKVPTYGTVHLDNAYPGIDIVFAKRERTVEYDLLVAPGADPTQIRLRTFALSSRIDERGDLLLETTAGTVRHTRPIAHATLPTGERLDVPCDFDPIDSDLFGISVRGLPPGAALVIDPQVGPNPVVLTPEYFSFLAGDRGEVATDVALRNGRATITGTTASLCPSPNGIPFPTTNTGYNQGPDCSGSTDVFVSRVNHFGTALEWSTIIGGSKGETDLDAGMGIDVDDSMTVWVAGITTNFGPAGNFPTTPGAAQASSNDNGIAGVDGFAFRLSADGGTLDYCTYVAGFEADFPLDIKVDANARAFVTGYTGSQMGQCPGCNFLNHVFLNGLETNFGATWAGFLVMISASGTQFSQSTFVQDGNTDNNPEVICAALDLLPDPSQPLDVTVYLTGAMLSAGPGGGIPIVGPAVQAVPGGAEDAFLLVMNPSFSAYTYGTYLGGDGADFGLGIAVADSGMAALTGSTTAYPGSVVPFPLKNAFDLVSVVSVEEGFVARIDPAAASSSAALLLSSYIGGELADRGLDVWTDSVGRTVYVAGQSYSGGSTFVGIGAGSGPFTALAGASDGFLLVVKNNQVVFGSFFGGSGDDVVNAIDVSDGIAILVGGSSVGSGPSFYDFVDGLAPGTLPTFQGTHVGGIPLSTWPPGLVSPVLYRLAGASHQDAFVLQLGVQ